MRLEIGSCKWRTHSNRSDLTIIGSPFFFIWIVLNLILWILNYVFYPCFQNIKWKYKSLKIVKIMQPVYFLKFYIFVISNRVLIGHILLFFSIKNWRSNNHQIQKVLGGWIKEQQYTNEMLNWNKKKNFSAQKFLSYPTLLMVCLTVTKISRFAFLSSAKARLL